MVGVNSLPKTVTRQRHDCDLNPGPSVPESSTLTTRLPSHPLKHYSASEVTTLWRYTNLFIIIAVTYTHAMLHSHRDVLTFTGICSALWVVLTGRVHVNIRSYI